MPCLTCNAQVHRNEGIIYMVLECGDIDLARLLQASRGALVGWLVAWLLG